MAGITLFQPGGAGLLNSAGAAHPAPYTIEVGLICQLSTAGVSTTTYRWTLTKPAGSASVLSSRSSAGPSFVPDVDGGAYSITLVDIDENTYILDIVIATTVPGGGGGSGQVPITVDVYADVRIAAFGGTTPPGSIVLRGATAIGDGGEGIFAYQPLSTADDDNGITLVTGENQRYVRIFDGAVDARWFGGRAERFLNPATGRLYTTSGYTTLAPDDAETVRAAVASLEARGGGDLYLAPGYWNFKTTDPLASYREFVIPCSNLKVSGGGGGTIIHIDAGANATGLGYAAAFGLFESSPTTDIDNVKFSDFVVDHNSDFNQYPGSPNNNYNLLAAPWNSAVMVQKGTNITIDNVESRNHNGIFSFLVGNYGDISVTTNVTIRNCKVTRPTDDPNYGDSSKFALGATNATVDGNIVDNTGSVNFPTLAPVSAFELHGTRLTVTNNKAHRMATSLNIGGDSDDMLDSIIAGNVFSYTLSGVSFFQLRTNKIQRLTIAHNTITVQQNTLSAFGEHALGTAMPSILGQPGGLGMFDVKVYGNEFTFVEGTPTSGQSFGMALFTNTGGGTHGGGFEVHDNKVSGFWGGIAFGSEKTAASTFTADNTTNVITSSSHAFLDGQTLRVHNVSGALPSGLAENTDYWVINATTHTLKLSLTNGGSAVDFSTNGTGTNYLVRNLHKDVKITRNQIKALIYGVYVAGAADPMAVFQTLSVLSNEVTDDAASPTLNNGVWVAAYTDANSAVWNNKVIGAQIAAEAFDTATFPNLLYYRQTVDAKLFIADFTGLGDAALNTPSIWSINRAPATVSVNQYPPATEWQGQAWNGSTTKSVSFFEQVVSVWATPSVYWAFQREGESAVILIQQTYFPSSSLSVLSSACDVFSVDARGSNQEFWTRYRKSFSVKRFNGSIDIDVITCDDTGLVRVADEPLNLALISVDVTGGGTITLTDAQSFGQRIKFVGAPGAPLSVVCEPSTGTGWTKEFWNDSGQLIAVKASAGDTGVRMQTGIIGNVLSDGTNAYVVDGEDWDSFSRVVRGTPWFSNAAEWVINDDMHVVAQVNTDSFAYWVLDVPQGSTISTVTAFLSGTGHGALPASMPTLTVHTHTISTNGTATAGTATDSSASTGAFDAAHVIEVAVSIVADNVDHRYVVILRNEHGANAQVGLDCYAIFATLTPATPDRGAA